MVLIREEQTPQIAPKCRSQRRKKKEEEGESPVRASCSISCPAGGEGREGWKFPGPVRQPGEEEKGKKKKKKKEKKEEKEEEEKKKPWEGGHAARVAR